MDARTHRQRENSIPTTNKVCGGYNDLTEYQSRSILETTSSSKLNAKVINRWQKWPLVAKSFKCFLEKKAINILQKITCHLLSDNVKTYGSAHKINRGAYMTAHVLLNLLNKLGKSEASCRNTTNVSKSLDPDKAQPFCRAWSGFKLFAKVISRQR